MDRYTPDLPQPESERDGAALANIRRYGWTWFRVFGAEGEPDPEDPAQGYEFSYTAGLWLTLSHPEIVLVGEWGAAHAITSAAVRLIESGIKLGPGQEVPGVLPDLPVRFGSVTPHAAKSLLTYADWVNQRQPFDAVQLILPDPAGRWPEDPDYVSFPQPSLGRVATMPSDVKTTRHLLVRLQQDEDGYPPFTAEEVDAVEVADQRFRLEAVPSFAFGLARGDVVRVKHDDEGLWVAELIEPSGHSSLRVIGLGGNSVDTPRRELEALGCVTSKTLIDGMIAVDVPPSVDFETVHVYLTAGQAASTWDFDIGVRADGEAR